MTDSTPRPTLLTPTIVVSELTKLNGEEALGWRIEDGALQRQFTFKNFHHTMAFGNAVAYVAHQLDHHPDIRVSYSQCTVAWSTHEPAGLTSLDFLAATKVNTLKHSA